jgi:hypothetical protein
MNLLWLESRLKCAVASDCGAETYKCAAEFGPVIPRINAPHKTTNKMYPNSRWLIIDIPPVINAPAYHFTTPGAQWFVREELLGV